MVFSTCIQQYLGIYCTIGSTVYPGVITNVHPYDGHPKCLIFRSYPWDGYWFYWYVWVYDGYIWWVYMMGVNISHYTCWPELTCWPGDVCQDASFFSGLANSGACGANSGNYSSGSDGTVELDDVMVPLMHQNVDWWLSWCLRTLSSFEFSGVIGCCWVLLQLTECIDGDDWISWCQWCWWLWCQHDGRLSYTWWTDGQASFSP